MDGWIVVGRCERTRPITAILRKRYSALGRGGGRGVVIVWGAIPVAVFLYGGQIIVQHYNDDSGWGGTEADGNRESELCEYLRPHSASQARDRQGSEAGLAGGRGRRWASGRSRCGESWSLPA